jgi:hypothetical protein
MATGSTTLPAPARPRWGLEVSEMQVWQQGDITVIEFEVQAVRMWLSYALEIATEAGDQFAMAFFTRALNDDATTTATIIGAGKVRAKAAGEQPMCAEFPEIH